MLENDVTPLILPSVLLEIIHMQIFRFDKVEGSLSTSTNGNSLKFDRKKGYILEIGQTFAGKTETERVVMEIWKC